MMLVKRVLLVARVDALGRVADVEVLLPAHAGVLLQDRHADFLGRARDRPSTRRRRSRRASCGGRPSRSPTRAAPRSGWRAALIGVGTATMMKSACGELGGVGGGVAAGSTPSARWSTLRRSRRRGAAGSRCACATGRSRWCGAPCRTPSRPAGRRSPGPPPRPSAAPRRRPAAAGSDGVDCGGNSRISDMGELPLLRRAAGRSMYQSIVCARPERRSNDRPVAEQPRRLARCRRATAACRRAAARGAPRARRRRCGRRSASWSRMISNSSFSVVCSPTATL